KSVEAKNTELENGYLTLKRSLSEMEQDYSEAETHILELEKVINQNREQFESLLGEGIQIRAELENQLKKSDQQLAGLTEKYDTLNRRCEKEELAKKDLESELNKIKSTLSSEISELTKNLTMSLEKQVQLRDQVDLLKRECGECNDLLVASQHDLEMKNKAVERMQSDLERMTMAKEIDGKNIEQLQQEIYQAEMKSLDKEKELISNLKVLKLKLQDLETENVQLKEAAIEANRSHLQLQSSQEEMKALLSTKENALSDSLQQKAVLELKKKAIVAEYEGKLESKELNINSLTQKVNQLSIECEELKCQSSQAKAQLELKHRDSILELQNVVEKSTVDSQEKQKRFESLVLEKKMVDQQLKLINDEFRDVYQTIFNREYLGETTFVSELKDLFRTQQSKESELLNQIHNHKTQYEKNTKLIESLEVQLESEQKLLIQLKSEHLENQTQLVEKFNQSQEMLQKTLNENDLVKEQSEKNLALVKSIQEKTNEQEKKIFDLQDQLKGENEKRVEEQSNNVKLNETHQQLQREFDELNGKISDLQSQLDFANQINQDWQQYGHDVAEEQGQLKEKVASLEIIIDDLENNIHKKNEQLDSNSKKLATMETAIKELKATIKDLDESLEDKESDLINCEKQLKLAKQSIDTLKMNFTTEMEKNSKKELKLKREIDSFHENLHKRTSECQDLRSMVDQLEREKIKLKASKGQLECKFEQSEQNLKSLHHQLNEMREELNSNIFRESELKEEIEELNRIMKSKESVLNSKTSYDGSNKLSNAYSRIHSLEYDVLKLADIIKKYERDGENVSDSPTAVTFQTEFTENALQERERLALNKLIESLENERNRLVTTVEELKSKLEDESKKLLEAEVTVQETRIKLKEMTVKYQTCNVTNQELKVQLLKKNSTTKLKYHERQQPTDLIPLYQREIEKLEETIQTERLNVQGEIESTIQREKIKIYEQSKLNLIELRNQYDYTIEKMISKQQDTEILLNDIEKVVYEERVAFQQREDKLLDEINLLKSNYYNINKKPPLVENLNQTPNERELEKRRLEIKIFELQTEIRKLRSFIDSQENEYFKERTSFLSEISLLKQDIESLKLQSQKHTHSPDEFNNLKQILKDRQDKLSQNEIQMKNHLQDFEEFKVQYSILEKQKETLERLVLGRENEIERLENHLNQSRQ
ncbi:hypothetical protein HDV02_001745, partial [Globomyces sp. JEL0801]